MGILNRLPGECISVGNELTDEGLLRRLDMFSAVSEGPERYKAVEADFMQLA